MQFNAIYEETPSKSSPKGKTWKEILVEIWCKIFHKNVGFDYDGPPLKNKKQCNLMQFRSSNTVCVKY